MNEIRNAKSTYARDARNLTPYRYFGEPIPPRAGGLSSPLGIGETVYVDASISRRKYVTVNGRQDGFGAQWFVRTADLKAVAS